MTDRNNDHEETLDRLISGIRDQSLDEATAHEAVNRVWQRVVAETDDAGHALYGCDDFSALIPALVGGTLPPARAMLVEDHTRECVSCRRRLLEARGAVPAQAVGQRLARRWQVPPLLRVAAIAIVALGVGVLAVRTVGDLIVERGLTATVEMVDGRLLQLAGDDSSSLSSGTTVTARQTLRTAKDSGALLRLADGSLIEMDARSQLELRGSLRGTTIALDRGNIIVHAADQRRGRLFVATDDCLVAVRGTIFAVDHGLKGSRVAVIEGEVEVRQPGAQHVLAPGEQVTTSARLHAVAISDQIAWSRNSEQHMALLRELTELHRDVSDAVEPRTVRTSTVLLDLAPPDTMIYVAIPNLAEGLGEARRILEQRLAASPELRAWWDSNVVDTGLEAEITELLDRLQPLGEAVGDEVVVTVPAAAFDGSRGPLVLARLDDVTSFTALLAEEVARVNSIASEPVITMVDDPNQIAEVTSDALLWVDGDLFAAATEAEALSQLAVRRAQPTMSDFVGGDLHARLSQAYRDGVAWLVGVDLGAILDRAAAEGSHSEHELMERLGLLDASTLVVERHRVGDAHAVSADLAFTGPRRGIAAWLADPAPMGSLEFVSPNASLATAVVAKDAADIFDELLGAISTADPDALADLAELEAMLGFDLRADLAVTLGGEAAVAIDGPMLPTPGWKLIAEVYDPETLQGTIERAVTELNNQLAVEGQSTLSFEQQTFEGRTYHEVRHPDTGAGVVYTMVDGYLVAAPQRALIERALQHRASGFNLPSSAAFRELLPDNGYTDCSALLYRNFRQLAEALPSEALPDLPPETLELIAEPSLYCVYGEWDRIVVSGTGTSLFGAAPILGLSSLVDHIDRVNTGSSRVSSHG